MMPSEHHDATGAWMAPMETRKARAEYYFQTVLDGQGKWYSKNAGRCKRRHVVLAILVIVLGALISVLQVLDMADWVRYLTAALGAAVTVTRLRAAVGAPTRAAPTSDAMAQKAHHRRPQSVRVLQSRPPGSIYHFPRGRLGR